MPVLAHQAALSMALGAFRYWLLGSGADAAPRSPARRAAGAVLLLLLAWQTVGCCWLPSVGSEELAPALSLAAIERGAGLCALLGAAAYLSRRASLAPEGLLTGLLFALLGVQAAAWARVFQVWRLLGSFSGTFFGALEPAALAASCALLALILRHEDSRPHRWRLAALALLLWAAPAQLELWRLSSRYGLARRSLAEDAGLKS
ncbi:MAG: hypothetical protein KGK30_06645, partial [Elusimicrobia bacterium]|nr:hypothetical protein [Elusimicrobiota bacterium]